MSFYWGVHVAIEVDVADVAVHPLGNAAGERVADRVVPAENDRHVARVVMTRSIVGRSLRMARLEGNVALVTGAGQGVGQGIAIALADEGVVLAHELPLPVARGVARGASASR